MSFCTSSLSSFRRVLEAEHGFIPRNENAVQGLHLPGARPIHPTNAAPPPYENNSAMNLGASDGPSVDVNATPHDELADIRRPEPRAETAQEPAQPGLMPNPVADVNADTHADRPAAGIEAIIKDNIIAIVTVVNSRFLPVRVVIQRWLRRAIRNIGPPHRQDIV